MTFFFFVKMVLAFRVLGMTLPFSKVMFIMLKESTTYLYFSIAGCVLKMRIYF